MPHRHSENDPSVKCTSDGRAYTLSPVQWDVAIRPFRVRLGCAIMEKALRNLIKLTLAQLWARNIRLFRCLFHKTRKSLLVASGSKPPLCATT